MEGLVWQLVENLASLLSSITVQAQRRMATAELEKVVTALVTLARCAQWYAPIFPLRGAKHTGNCTGPHGTGMGAW